MKHSLEHSFAKINLCLNITGKREDGFHLLDMVMVPVSLHDSILVKELANNDNFVTIDDFNFGQSGDNIISKGIESLAEKYGFTTKFRVDVHKVIPMQAGLGGGSSNAAYSLKAVNKLLKLNASEQDLLDISKKIGCDVPFFINPKPYRVQGTGEILKPINIKNDYHVLIVKPMLGCSTKEIYDAYDALEVKEKQGNVDDVIKALETGDDELLANSMFNVLEFPAMQKVPEILKIKQELKEKYGFKIVLMSGSGSAVFALSHDLKAIKKAANKLEDMYTVAVCKILKD